MILQLLILLQLIPQIVINYRRHDTEGLQPSMMLLWAVAGVPLGVYNIVEQFNIALRIQPQILTILSLLTWTQCLYYGNVSSKSSRTHALKMHSFLIWSIEMVNFEMCNHSSSTSTSLRRYSGCIYFCIANCKNSRA